MRKKEEQQALTEAIRIFWKAAAAKYGEKYEKYGDSWRTIEFSELTSHFEKHVQELLESDYDEDKLTGLGLLTMFLLYRKKMG